MRLKLIALLLVSAFPLSSHAVSVSGAKSASFLYEPLRASAYVAVDADETLESVRLAPPSSFAKAGLEWLPVFSELSVSSDPSADPLRHNIRFRSAKPVYEPALNVLVEIRTSNGVSYKQVSLFLDAPYDGKVMGDENARLSSSLSGGSTRVRRQARQPSAVASPADADAASVAVAQRPRTGQRVKDAAATSREPKKPTSDEASQVPAQVPAQPQTSVFDVSSQTSSVTSANASAQTSVFDSSAKTSAPSWSSASTVTSAETSSSVSSAAPAESTQVSSQVSTQASAQVSAQVSTQVSAQVSAPVPKPVKPKAPIVAQPEPETSVFKMVDDLVPGGVPGIAGVFSVFAAAGAFIAYRRRRSASYLSGTTGLTTNGTLEFGESTLGRMEENQDKWQQSYDNQPGLGLGGAAEDTPEETPMDAGPAAHETDLMSEGPAESSSLADLAAELDSSSGHEPSLVDIAADLDSVFDMGESAADMRRDTEDNNHGQIRPGLDIELQSMEKGLEFDLPSGPETAGMSTVPENVNEAPDFELGSLQFDGLSAVPGVAVETTPVVADAPSNDEGALNFTDTSSQTDWKTAMDAANAALPETQRRPPIRMELPEGLEDGPARFHLELACFYASNADWDSFNESIAEVMKEGTSTEKEQAERLLAMTKS